MKKQILLPQEIDENAKLLFLSSGYELVKCSDIEVETLREKGKQAIGIIVFGGHFGAEQMDVLPHLKVIGRFGVGIDNVDNAAAKARGIKIVNTPSANSHSVADAVLMSILMLAREPMAADCFVKRKLWSRNISPDKALRMGQELRNLTVGIVGLGSIGTEVATRCLAFGMRVISYTPSQKKMHHVENVSFEKLLEESDFISLNCAGNSQTYHLINKEALSRMKNSAYIINFARGSVIDTTALVEALQKQKIAGAALDVFEEEPLDENDPLLGLDNVLLFPHFGSSTSQAIEKISKQLANNMINTL